MYDFEFCVHDYGSVCKRISRLFLHLFLSARREENTKCNIFLNLKSLSLDQVFKNILMN